MLVFCFLFKDLLVLNNFLNFNSPRFFLRFLIIVELTQLYFWDKTSIAVPDLKLFNISSFCFSVSLLVKPKNEALSNIMLFFLKNKKVKFLLIIFEKMMYLDCLGLEV